MKKSGRIINFLSLGWLLVIVALFFYSLTQIDLGLTLTRVSFWQVIQRRFQSIGYFNRPLSTILYLTILLILYTLYFILLLLSKKRRLTSKQLWWLIGLTVVVLLPSYPAFSHDLFNYIFDARIVAFYHQNPYKVKPLDFAGDPMLGFMHWTHRPSVYPLPWIVLSLFPFVLGFGKLILQILTFKTMMTACYLGTVWLIGKISEELSLSQKFFNMAFYALNPLVIIESLVSAHNDSMMVFFALLGFYLWLKKKTFLSFLSWLFSIGIKYVTAVLLPVFALAFWRKIRVKKVNYQKLIIVSILVMYFGVFYFSYRLGFQPWYLLWVLPFVAVKTESKFFTWFTTSFSFGALLRYPLFLYHGHWNPPIPTINFWLTFLPIGLTVLAYSFTRVHEFRTSVKTPPRCPEIVEGLLGR